MKNVSVRSNVIANFASQGWTALMGLAFVPFYIRHLGSEAYGLVGVFALILSLLPILDLGMSPALSREMARFRAGALSIIDARNLLRTVELVFACVAVLVVVAIGGSAHWVAGSWLKIGELPVHEVAYAVVLIGAIVGLRFFELAYRSTLIGLQQQLLLSGINASLATARGLGAVAALTWLSPTIITFFVWQIVVSIGSTLTLAQAVYKTLPATDGPARFSGAALRAIRGFAGGMVGISLLSLSLMQTDKLLLSKLLPLNQYGYYMLAASIASLVYTIVTPIAQAYYPRFVELLARGDDKELARSYHTASQLVTVLAGSIGFMLIGFAEPALRLWSHDLVVTSRVAPVLAVQTLGIVLNCLMWMPYQLQLAHGIVRIIIKANLVAIVFIVPLIIWIAPRYGPVGAAWVWAALNLAYIVIVAPIMYRRILSSEEWAWYMKDLLAPLLAVCVVGTIMRRVVAEAHEGWMEIPALLLSFICMLFAAAMAASLIKQRIIRTRRWRPTFMHWPQ